MAAEVADGDTCGCFFRIATLLAFFPVTRAWTQTAPPTIQVDEASHDAATGILGRRALVVNNTGKPFVIESASSGTWNLPRGTDYVLRYLSGRWGGEWTVNDRNVQPGKTVLESRRGSTGAQNNPWFSIRTSDTTEDGGRLVWRVGLEWFLADRC